MKIVTLHFRRTRTPLKLFVAPSPSELRPYDQATTLVPYGRDVTFVLRDAPAERPSAKRPSAKRPSAKRPSAKRPSTKKPRADNLAAAFASVGIEIPALFEPLGRMKTPIPQCGPWQRA